MVRYRWIHYIFIILNLLVNWIANQSDEIVQCDIIENNGLKFYCHGTVEQENSHKGSYFCCETYLYCFGGNWVYKTSIHSIEFYSGCQFKNFERSLFLSYSGVDKLSLSNVGLEVLRLQDFAYAGKLLTFDASHNKITEIPAMIFMNAPKIAEVNFSFNRISRIDPMAFEHSSYDLPSELRVLDLSNNKIVSIDNRTFAALSALDTLYLSSNLIQVIESDAFAQNQNLNVLQLSYNKLTHFTCQKFGNLIQLHLMSNYLTSFDGSCFNSTYFLYLNVENNQLTNIDLNFNDLSKLRAFSNKLRWITGTDDLDALEVFNVSRNRIENIPDSFNRFGKTLKFLDVTDNFVGKLNVSTFMEMQNLEELVLRNTCLSNIQYGTFHHQKNLKLLDISFNNFKTINFNVFGRDLRQLNTFLVDGNDLTEVNGLSPVNFPNLTQIGITRNNFVCDYLVGYVRQWTGVTFLADALLNRSHIEKVSCIEGTEGHYATGFHNNDTEKLQIESVTSTTSRATRVIEHRYIDNGSTNRVLLVLVLVVLCIICVVVVTKNVILIWNSRRRLRGEGEVTYCNDTHEDGIIRTDLLDTSDL